MSTAPNKITHRQRQAEATRAQIVAAARRLFDRQGYVETTIAQIAEEAGVAVQTVYKSMRSKPAVLMALVDAINEESNVAELQRRLASTEDPAELISICAAITRQIQERCGDIIRAVASASNVDRAAAAVLAEGERRHRDATGHLANRLHARDALRPGLSAKDAAVLVSLLTSRHAYDELVYDRGLTFEQAQAVIERALTTALI